VYYLASVSIRGAYVVGALLLVLLVVLVVLMVPMVVVLIVVALWLIATFEL
jgi:hypothetical protein